MARKTITIDRDSYARLVAAQRPGETFSQAIDRLARVKTNADALSFYRRKKTWLSARKIELIERVRAGRGRSPRS
jgi:predicted CopG family antitoxin